MIDGASTRALLVATALLLASSCGADGTDGTSSADGTAGISKAQSAPESDESAQTVTTDTSLAETVEPSATTTPSHLPDISATDVATGETVSLASFSGSGTPVALWFWFPH